MATDGLATQVSRASKTLLLAWNFIFTERTVALPQDVVKSGSREIQV